jgi:hypothetical protein
MVPDRYVPEGTAGASTSSDRLVSLFRSTVSGVTIGSTTVPSLRVSVMLSITTP